MPGGSLKIVFSLFFSAKLNVVIEVTNHNDNKTSNDSSKDYLVSGNEPVGADTEEIQLNVTTKSTGNVTEGTTTCTGTHDTNVVTEMLKKVNKTTETIMDKLSNETRTTEPGKDLSLDKMSLKKAIIKHKLESIINNKPDYASNSKHDKHGLLEKFDAKGSKKLNLKIKSIMNNEKQGSGTKNRMSDTSKESQEKDGSNEKPSKNKMKYVYKPRTYKKPGQSGEENEKDEEFTSKEHKSKATKNRNKADTKVKTKEESVEKIEVQNRNFQKKQKSSEESERHSKSSDSKENDEHKEENIEKESKTKSEDKDSKNQNENLNEDTATESLPIASTNTSVTDRTPNKLNGYRTHHKTTVILTNSTSK